VLPSAPAPCELAAIAKPRRPVVFQPPGFKDELCAFFRGTGMDIECRYLEQILKWDDTLMEVCHDYIQWLLPTDEASKFNSDAPILDPECQRIFRDDAVIQRNLRRGAQRFMTFLGLAANLDSQNNEPPRIVKAQNFQKRMLMCWKGPENHNWKRISRALRCFGLVGMEDVQQALLTCLEEIIVEYPGMVDDKTVGHWLDEACVKSKLVHSITPGYVAALLGSPNMMTSLCKQFFEKYDSNGDGQLDVHEVTLLASELDSSLGLPSDAMDEASVSASIAAFSTDGMLSGEDFPLWFAQALKDVLKKGDKVKVEPPAEDKPADQHLEHIRPGYVAALLQSPQLLETICKSYFQRYDKNGNGELDPQEALQLSIDLHESLNVLPGIITEEQIVASMAAFTQGRTGSALSADEFPGWFRFALQQTLEERQSPRYTN